MPCQVGFGTQTATVGEEHVLQDIAAKGTYTLEVDTSAMQAGDAVELRIYLALLSGTTPKCAMYESYEGVQDPDETIKYSERVSVDQLSPGSAYRATLKQVAGTSRDFPWRIECRQDAPQTT